MKIPKTQMIFGQKWTIKQVKAEDVPDEDYGNCNPKTRTILINKDKPRFDMEQTFLHECVHAIFHRTGVTQAIDEGVEEIIAENISTWMMEEHLKIKP